MSTAEHLHALAAALPPGIARRIVRDALLGMSEADVAAWHRLQTAKRTAEYRTRKTEAQRHNVTAATETPASQSDGGHNESHAVTSAPEAAASPAVAASAPPQNPVANITNPPKEPPKGGSRARRSDPASVAIPETLAAATGFPALWATYLRQRGERRQKFDPTTAEFRLRKFAERPADAVAALTMAVENGWQGFQWAWFDREQVAAPRANGHPRPAASVAEERDKELHARVNPKRGW